MKRLEQPTRLGNEIYNLKDMPFFELVIKLITTFKGFIVRLRGGSTFHLTTDTKQDSSKSEPDML